MRSTEGKIVVVLAAVVVAMSLFVFLRDDEDGGDEATPVQTSTQSDTGAPPKPAEPEVPLIVFKGGEPVGGPVDLEFSKGDRIRFRVRSDVEEEIHMHGYDVSKEVASGATVSYDVPADIEGVFEVEMENSAVPIAEITVSPG